VTKQDYLDFHKAMCERMIETTKKKNADYTGGDEDPFANFKQVNHVVQLPKVVEIGFVTRLSDKFARIGAFVTKGILEVKDETVEDTLIDMANYCILFAGYLRSQRPPKGRDTTDPFLPGAVGGSGGPFRTFPERGGGGSSGPGYSGAGIRTESGSSSGYGLQAP
jgi:hypothetical protein